MTAIQWLTPQPLWDEFVPLPDKTAFRRPLLLRFATDAFMAELRELLRANPAGLRNVVARPETWTEPACGLGPVGTTSTSLAGGLPLKLYQPIHHRFYLVAAALTCRLPGLPDHTVHLEARERTSFVLRRVQPLGVGSVFDPARRSESAWLGTTDGGVWSAAPADGAANGEERLPLFPVYFDAADRRRRILAGFIPVARRQGYAAGRDAPVATGIAAGAGAGTTGPSSAGASAPASPVAELEPWFFDFYRLVLEPWTSVRDWWDTAVGTPADAEAAEQQSALVLLDVSEFLARYLLPVSEAVRRGTPGTLSGAALALYSALAAAKIAAFSGAPALEPDASRITLRAAIAQAEAHRRDIEALALTGTRVLPAAYKAVVLAGAQTDLDALLARGAGSTNDNPLPRRIEQLVRDAMAALPAPVAATTAASGPVVATSQPRRVPTLPPEDQAGAAWYVVRCLYERPRCGRDFAPVASPPSEPFQLGAFYDPEAPTRALSIELPIDTSPAALRKYDRNVTVLLSDELRAQLKRVKKIKDLMDGSPGSTQVDFSVMCSMSIPIITICAMILLMIMVNLLNIVFRWLPYFIICFPMPRLKAKPVV